MSTNIEDFGEKIGGAKKDLWHARGLAIDDIKEFNNAERSKYIKKDNVWKKPDYEKLAEEKSVKIAYFIKTVRDGLPTKPVVERYIDAEDLAKKEEGYISVVGAIRDAAMKIKDEEQIKTFFKDTIAPYLVNPEAYRVRLKPEAFDCITNKLLKAVSQVRNGFHYLDRDIERKQFCFSEEKKLLAPYDFVKYDADKTHFEKHYRGDNILVISFGIFGRATIFPDEKWNDESLWKKDTYFAVKNGRIITINHATEEDCRAAVLKLERDFQQGKPVNGLTKKKRKRAFVPKQLSHIERTGDDYRKDTLITGNDYLNAFKFRGGEFGNWLNEKDRQSSLNFGYDAFTDLCLALDIAPEDVSIGGKLAIAFGARGSGNALAHYEPEREVINLTKMRGAGSLAHEWGHAMDDIIGKALGYSGMMSMNLSGNNIPPAVSNLIGALKFKKDETGNRVRTDFYQNSISFDKGHSKTDHGYWQSTVEMFARAFACYVKDKLAEKGVRSDYLCGHADMAVSQLPEPDGSMKTIKAYPDGKEREDINKCFDEMFVALKELGLFHSFEKAVDISTLENYKPPLDRRIASSFTELTSGPVNYDVELRDNKGQLEFSLF